MSSASLSEESLGRVCGEEMSKELLIHYVSTLIYKYSIQIRLASKGAK